MYITYLRENELFNNVRVANDVKEINNKKLVEAYDFDFLDLVITVGFTKTFPYELPLYRIRKTEKLYAHVDQTGYICSKELNDLNYDVTDPKSLINNSIEEIRNILLMDSDQQKEEINREFSDYYTRNINCKDIPHEIKFKGIKTDDIFIDSDNFNHNEVNQLNVIEYLNFTLISSSKKGHYDFKQNNTKPIRTIIYLPLCDIPQMPYYDVPLTTDYFIDYIEKYNLDKIQKKPLGSVEEYLLGYRYLDDFRYMYIKLFNHGYSKRSLGSKGTKIFPNRVNIISTEFLRLRGGSKVYNNRILLIGVGSLGSEVLSLLCKSGFTDITIVDDDLTSIYNTFRHTIGFDTFFHAEENGVIFQKNTKVSVLKAKMESMYPGVFIKTIEQSIQQYLVEQPIEDINFKYIISTTGNTIAEKMLNRFIYKNRIDTRLIIAWLEAFGIGRHILLNDGRNVGCFECLLKSSHYVRFLKPNDYKIYEDTCIGSYTKFGAIDSVTLASEVTNLVIQFEGGHDFINRHIVKKGTIIEAVDPKYIHYKYFDKSQSELDMLEFDFYYEGCDCCG